MRYEERENRQRVLGYCLLYWYSYTIHEVIMNNKLFLLIIIFAIWVNALAIYNRRVPPQPKPDDNICCTQPNIEQTKGVVT